MSSPAFEAPLHLRETALPRQPDHLGYEVEEDYERIAASRGARAVGSGHFPHVRLSTSVPSTVVERSSCEHSGKHCNDSGSWFPQSTGGIETWPGASHEKGALSSLRFRSEVQLRLHSRRPCAGGEVQVLGSHASSSVEASW